MKKNNDVKYPEIQKCKNKTSIIRSKITIKFVDILLVLVKKELSFILKESAAAEKIQTKNNKGSR